MNSGIISQYGFLYQRLYYFLTILEKANTELTFTYEGKDDINISHNDSISMVRIPNEKYIQVKSGNVSPEVFCKIIGNWMLDYDENIEHKAVFENGIKFSISLEEFIQWVKNGHDKKKNSIVKRNYQLFQLNNYDYEQKASHLFNNYKTEELGIDNIESRITEQFVRDYCEDILEYDKAKEKRCEMLISLLNNEVDNSIKEKKPCIISYPKLMSLIGTVKESISDNNYEVNITEIKKSLQKNAETIVNENKTREVEQLKKVSSNNEFIIREIVNELIYKDFRDVYKDIKELKISNIEQIAKSNYDNALFSFTNDPTPKEIFNKTVNTEISNSFMPRGPMYNRGCYTFLTGENIDEELQITWSIYENE